MAWCGYRRTIQQAKRGADVERFTGQRNRDPAPEGSSMNLTLKYRLYPTKAQIEFLNGELREACDLYNCALQERIGAWKICRKLISYYDQQNQLPAMRADGCLTMANCTCSQDVLHRLDRTFKAFFARVKRG